MKIKCMLFEPTNSQIKKLLEASGEEVELGSYPEIEQDENVKDDYKTYGKDPRGMNVKLPAKEDGTVLLVPGWYERLFKNLPEEERRDDCYVLPKNIFGIEGSLSFEDLTHVTLEGSLALLRDKA